jgi:hypothetical protein
VTVELVTQLNEMLKCKDGVDRTKLHRLVKNLITQATTGADVVDEHGKVIHEGAGDLTNESGPGSWRLSLRCTKFRRDWRLSLPTSLVRLEAGRGSPKRCGI